MKVTTEVRTASLALALLVIAGCPGPRQAEAPLQLGIITPSFDYLPLKVAEAQAGRKSPGLSLHGFNSGWELGEALVAGKVDAAIVPFTYVVSAQARGADVRIVACLEHEDDGIIARPEITRLEELAGRKVGCLKASTIELLLRQALDARGIRAEIVYFTSPLEMWAALERRDVDALSYYVPGIIKAEGRIGHIIHWYRTDWAMHPCCDIAVNAGRIRGRERQVRELIRTLDLGSARIRQDTAFACSVAVSVYGLSDSVARQSLRVTPFRVSLTRAETEFELNTARLMHELGYLPEPANPERLYLRGFVAREE
jgi:ABC-type nitrate/sulfonate/bicarbonate transport system substrate-binding protein